MFQESGNSARSDFDTETIVLKGNQKVVVSCQLSVLILQVLSKYRNCPIIQDSFLSKSGIYKYLFDSNLNFIRSLEDLYEPPILVIISCRSKIPEGTLFSTRTLKERNETEENKSCNIIDMYKSIIPKAKLNRKIHKSPLYKLKAFASPTKPLKPPVPEYNHSDPLFSQIFPFSLGKKVKEGAGGFKKPVLLFEKEKSSFSPCLSSRKYSEQRLKKSASVSKSVLNDVINVDQACAKYSLPKQDFLKILNEFTYLKGFYGRLFVGTLQKAYNVSLDVFKGIGHTQNSTNEVVWDEFVKFFVIVVLKRGSFSDLAEFLLRFLGITENSQLFDSTIEKTWENEGVFEKIGKIFNILKTKTEKGSLLHPDTYKIMKNEGFSLSELRILVSSLIKSL